jgi:hypothetical protein
VSEDSRFVIGLIALSQQFCIFRQDTTNILELVCISHGREMRSGYGAKVKTSTGYFLPALGVGRRDSIINGAEI